MKANENETKDDKNVGININDLPILTICGSAKFKDDIADLAAYLQLKGVVILTPYFGGIDTMLEYERRLLGEIHHKKISLSDAILVVNNNDYIGLSTIDEIIYAHNSGKTIIFYYKPISYAILYILEQLGITYQCAGGHKDEIKKILDNVQNQLSPKTE